MMDKITFDLFRFFSQTIMIAALVCLFILFFFRYIELEAETQVYGNSNLYEFIKLSEQWADTHKYNKTSYNCVNFTKDVFEIGNMAGVNVEKVSGCPINDSDESCHSWLRLTVDFEPQYAEFVDYSEKYK